MKSTLQLIFVLTLICLVSGALLAFVHDLTTEPIRAAAMAERMEAVEAVLPEHDNRPEESVREIRADKTDWTFYVATRGGQYAGAAFECESRKGYGGSISVMVGVTADGKVHAIRVLQQKETPGLGAKILEPEFAGQFAGRAIAGTRWAVAKDQGEIDQITAATISSRAVTEAVKSGLDVYLAHEAEIRP